MLIVTPDKDLGQCVRGSRVVQYDRRKDAVKAATPKALPPLPKDADVDAKGRPRVRGTDRRKLLTSRALRDVEAWLAATGRRPDEETIEAACDTARAWDGVVVAPLRAVRRTLKAPVPDIDDGPRQLVRERIKGLELEAERHLLEALEALAPMPSGAPRPVIDGLTATTRLWSRVTPRPALIRLAEALPA